MFNVEIDYLTYGFTSKVLGTKIANLYTKDLLFTKCIRILGMPIPDFYAQPYMQNHKIAYFLY